MKKIVLAEDNDLFRSILRKMLTDFDIVGEAIDGPQAVETVMRTKPDLLILDLSLPRLSGITVIRELRKHGANPKILVLSVHDRDSIVQQAIDVGADAYCSKMESREKIRMTIENLWRE